ncbi:hypothetical protein CY34DRAFT_804180 [Suillus luteus UH-Slu-Lm8-n1]|uniref:Uncharacterized protein n=1 Tax=Suillus luteus UH-Slu-Lm8-n1 TaxID=930992 RepID=A0A0D0AMP5_9AGAM|nr:hypothetical protein CY34DRAFT_804180 [Suillus luteus UH-Slu-Lm8-n1]
MDRHISQSSDSWCFAISRKLWWRRSDFYLAGPRRLMYTSTRGPVVAWNVVRRFEFCAGTVTDLKDNLRVTGS